MAHIKRGSWSMPWSTKDADKHKKGLTPQKKQQWVAVANSVLKEPGNEGRAIRAANSKTK
jgi:uncharacterized protein YdaT